MNTTDKIIEKFLHFSGERSYTDFLEFQTEVLTEKGKHKQGTREYVCLTYINKKLIKGKAVCVAYDSSIIVDIEDSIEDVERGYDQTKETGKSRKTPKKKNGKDLGKIVDQGEDVEGGKADNWWGKEGIDLVFTPNDETVRKGESIPGTYKYKDVRYIEKYYGLKAIEFGNWLSQQDRVNYLSGLGIALFDLHKLLGFKPEQMSLDGKLTIAFGARGHGNSGVAQFFPKYFAINLTRYSRPAELKSRPKNFKRVNLILKDGGGVGAFAHEFAHALDCFGGEVIEKKKGFEISGGKSLNHDQRLQPAKKLQGLMNVVMNKILWKNKNTRSDYYTRLKKEAGKYELQRNEIWARSFEVYVQYKLAKQKHKNIFLNEPKYDEIFYLTFPEMKKMEGEYDALMAEIKRHL